MIALPATDLFVIFICDFYIIPDGIPISFPLSFFLSLECSAADSRAPEKRVRLPRIYLAKVIQKLLNQEAAEKNSSRMCGEPAAAVSEVMPKAEWPAGLKRRMGGEGETSSRISDEKLGYFRRAGNGKGESSSQGGKKKRKIEITMCTPELMRATTRSVAVCLHVPSARPEGADEKSAAGGSERDNVEREEASSTRGVRLVMRREGASAPPPSLSRIGVTATSLELSVRGTQFGTTHQPFYNDIWLTCE